MPRICTEQQLSLCSMSLESVRHGSLTNIAIQRVCHSGALRLARYLPTPIVLEGTEYRQLPVFFYCTGFIREDGIAEHRHGITTERSIYRLEAQHGGHISSLRWQDNQHSLACLVKIVQDAVGEAVSTDTFFSFKEDGEMFLLLEEAATHDRIDARAVTPAVCNSVF